MFEKREEVPEFHPKDCAQPSLEAIMALQKMLEDGLLDHLDEIPETPPSVVHPAIDRAARATGQCRSKYFPNCLLLYQRSRIQAPLSAGTQKADRR
jgi:hypothetical protein